MSIGLKGSGESSYRSLWGKWFVIVGCFMGLIAFVLSAWLILWPSIPLLGYGSTSSGSNYHLYSHGAYYFKLWDDFTWINSGDGWTHSGFSIMASVSLAPIGYFAIVLMCLSVILPLIGYAQSRSKLFKVDRANKMFVWFVVVVCTIGILSTITLLISSPNSNIKSPLLDDDSNLVSGQCFKSLFFNTIWSSNNGGDGMLDKLVLSYNTNGYVLIGVMAFAIFSILLTAFYTFRAMFWNISAREEINKRKSPRNDSTITL